LLQSDLFDAREDIAREVHSREFAAIREDQYARDGPGSLVGTGHGCLAGVGFWLRSGGGFITVFEDSTLFFHILWNCGVGSSALVALARGQGFLVG
jgi:hypothetical protein